MMLNRLIGLILFLFASSLSAQVDSGGIIFTGVVFDAQNLEQLSDAVYRKDGQSYALQDGALFRIRGKQGDTIVFSYLGYQSLSVVLNDSLYGGEYLVGVYLSPSLQVLSEVLVMPRYYDLGTVMTPELKSLYKAQVMADKNMSLVTYKGLQPPKTMDHSMNQRIAIDKQRMTVEYKQMLKPNELVGADLVTIIPETKDFMDDFKDERLQLDMGKITSAEETYYLKSLYRAVMEERLLSKENK